MSQSHFLLRNAWRVVAIATMCVAVGCARSDEALVPVAGQVLLDGKPLAGGVIVTMPERGRGARAEIGADGQFVLSTKELGAGATAGTHRVAVTWLADAPGASPEAPRQSRIPTRYASAETSGLSIDVTGAGNENVVLNLESKP